MRIFCCLVLLGLVSLASSKTLDWPAHMSNPFSRTALPSKIETQLVSLHYVDPKSILAVITDKKHGFLSSSGVAVVEEKQRKIWLQDAAPNIQKILNLIRMLDSPRKEVLLKARIVSIDDEYIKDLGIMFQSSGTHEKKESGLSQAVDTIGNFTMPIANLGDGRLLDVKLNALEKNGHAKVISSPELTTLDHEEALIEAGEEVPYQQETANGGTSVSFKKAVLKLQVVPHILSHQNILLNLHVNQDKVSALTVQGVPAIHTQQLATQIVLKNKQTFVLGGIYEISRSDQVQGVPFLKNIPLLGYLFRSHHHLDDHREMLIFITPEVLKG